MLLSLITAILVSPQSSAKDFLWTMDPVVKGHHIKRVTTGFEDPFDIVPGLKRKVTNMEQYRAYGEKRFAQEVQNELVKQLQKMVAVGCWEDSTLREKETIDLKNEPYPRTRSYSYRLCTGPDKYGECIERGQPVMVSRFFRGYAPADSKFAYGGLVEAVAEMICVERAEDYRYIISKYPESRVR